MGLDTYPSHSEDDYDDVTPEDAAAFESAGIDLCGGMCSDGVVSIRGKIYDDIVREVSGESLYTSWLEPEAVARIAQAFAALTPEQLAEINDCVRTRYSDISTSPNEMADLRRYFMICAERGLGLIAST